MVIKMYFAVTFSRLDYTYTIPFAVHFRIINVAVPVSVFGLTPPPPTSFPTVRAYAQRACWRDRAHSPASSRRKAPRCWPRPAGVPGRRPAQFAPLCNLKRIAFPGPVSAASRELNREIAFLETGSLYFGLKFCFQVHVGEGLGSGGVRRCGVGWWCQAVA